MIITFYYDDVLVSLILLMVPRAYGCDTRRPAQRLTIERKRDIQHR